ncbi:MAG: DUF2141 domain-containing protein [Myxococcales bacterium]|jgi:uncharacterized protein (DUF2141 family)
MPRQRPLLWAWIAIASLNAPPQAAADPGSPTAAESLVVQVSNIPNDKGQIGCSLYADKNGFPSDPKMALQSLFVTSKDGKATCTFKEVKPGRYAVSVMHDENKDGELETSIVGRPKEWWGVSNNVPPERFGPPKYGAAAFDIGAERKTIRVKLRL